MSAYEYVALDPGGRQKKGLLEGDTARQVRQILREQGLTPLSVEETRGERGSSQRRHRGLFKPRISPTELALITRQLATLVRSGLPLEEAVQNLTSWNLHIFLMRQPHGLVTGSDVVFLEAPQVESRNMMLPQEDA